VAVANKQLIEKDRKTEVKQVKRDKTNATEIDARPRFGSLTYHLLKLGTPETDGAYQKRYNDASGLTEKGKVLTEYSEHYPDLFSKSAWVKTALADAPHMLVPPGGKNDKGVPWYDFSEETLRRRRIVLKNLRMSAASLCKVFDAHQIPLPSNWEGELGVTTWIKAYKTQRARARIQRIISTDRKQK
jgi:hypothetical protein